MKSKKHEHNNQAPSLLKKTGDFFKALFKKIKLGFYRLSEYFNDIMLRRSEKKPKDDDT